MGMVNVIDSIVITVENDITHIMAEWMAVDPDITITEEWVSGYAVRLFLNWSDGGGTLALHEGDYFTFQVPELFRQDTIATVTDGVITTPEGVCIATYTIGDNSENHKEVRVTFTDYVEQHTPVSGYLWLLLFVAHVETPQQQILQFIINGNLAAEGDVTVNPAPRNSQPINRKSGFSILSNVYDGYYVFSWSVDFNMEEDEVNGFHVVEDFSFTDVIPEDSPHIFLTDAVRQAYGIAPSAFPFRVGEYKRADGCLPEDRYALLYAEYNGSGADFWTHEYIPMITEAAVRA